MMIYTKARKWFFVFLTWMLLTAASFADTPEETTAQSQKRLSISIKALKDVYKPGEPVPLVLAIANHGGEAIYIHKLNPYIEIKDTNSVRIMGDPVPTPPPSPPHYYMEKEGKRIYVVPVFKIGGPEVILELIPDAIERYHKHLSEGNYYLRANATKAVYHESSLIFRQDFPNQLWVEPQPGVLQLELQSNTVKIQIRRKPAAERPKPLLFAWPSFLTGAAAGIAIIGVVLLLRKKASSRGKSRAT